MCFDHQQRTVQVHSNYLRPNLRPLKRLADLLADRLADSTSFTEHLPLAVNQLSDGLTRVMEPSKLDSRVTPNIPSRKRQKWEERGATYLANGDEQSYDSEEK